MSWISVEDKLPEINDWVNVLYDRNEGDYWDRRGKPRYSVYSAQLRSVDEEGYATWQLWKCPGGAPISPLYLVTHWQPYPEPPSEID